MAPINLKGIAIVRAKGREYHYAWRGGPRLGGKPGSPEYVASYVEAHENLRTSDPARFRALVTLYKANDVYKDLEPTTRKNWAPWLDRIAEHFGPLRLSQFDRIRKIRPIILRWRSRYAATPRTADYGMQVLSRVLSFGVEQGRLCENACLGIPALYSVDRSDIIWTDADIAQLKSACSEEIGWAVDLAAYTGLRFSDLIRLSWTHIGDNAIVLTTGKSKHRREAVVPLYAELRAVLSRIPKRASTVLTNTRGRPWTHDGLGSSFNKAKRKAKLAERDLHFHDLRGTAATKFYLADIKIRVIAEMLAWSEEQVDKIIRRYVTRNAAVLDMIERLDRAERRT